MKLSADAKRHVAAQVAAAFADRLSELRQAMESAKAERDRKVEEIAKAVDRFGDEVVRPNFLKLVKSLGKIADSVDMGRLRWSAAFEWKDSSPFYGACDIGRDNTDTIRAYDGLGDAYKAAKEAFEDLEDEVKKRVSFALFEIEIHGRKDTLEKIVKEAIDGEIGNIGKKGN